jgi:translation initiation factor IF-2
MEQRALRLGDLVDDYCPRERRITDHVIVALVDDTIRQTRCSACESEHEYKEARMPRKKTRPEDGPALTGGVLVMPKPAPANGHAADTSIDSPAAAASPNSASDVRAATPIAPIAAAPAPAADGAAGAPDAAGAGEPEPVGAWFGHRPLIRATLPKTEHDVPAPRAIPEFTMHQRQGRGFGGGGRGFRPHGFGGHAGSNGNGPMRDGNVPDGNRAPGPGGPGGGGPGGKGRHRRRHRRPR